MTAFGIFIAVLPVLLSAAALVSVQLLKREARSRFDAARELGANTTEGVRSISAALDQLRRDLARMEERRREDAGALLAEESRTAKALQGVRARLETLSKLEAGVDALLAREDAAAALERLEALLRDAPAALGRDEESAMSRAMEEGISSILGYAAGKVPGVELRL